MGGILFEDDITRLKYVGHSASFHVTVLRKLCALGKSHMLCHVIIAHNG